MSNALVAALVAGALTGTIAGAAAGFLLASPRDRAAETAAPDLSRTDIAVRIDELGTENDDLRARLQALENRSEMVAGAVSARESVEFAGAPPKSEELLASLEQLALAMSSPDNVSAMPPGFQASVAQAVQDVRDQERLAEEQRRAEQRLARNVERVDRLAEDLGLDAWQSEEMLVVYNERDTAFEALRDELGDRGFGGGRGFRDAGDGFNQMREEYDKKVQTILSPEQYLKYQEENSRFFGGFGRGAQGSAARGGRGEGGDAGGAAGNGG